MASAKRLLPDRAPPRTKVTLRRVGVSTVITHLRRFIAAGHLRAGRTIRAPPHPVNARLFPSDRPVDLRSAIAEGLGHLRHAGGGVIPNLLGDLHRTELRSAH